MKKSGVKAEIRKELSEQDLKDLHNLKCSLKGYMKYDGTGGCFYFLGFLGAAVYFVGTAPSFWDAVIGFLKAIVWPAFAVYGLLSFAGM